MIAACVEPTAQVVLELRERGGGAIGRGLEPLGQRGGAGRERGGNLAQQQPASLADAQRRLGEDAHGIGDRRPCVVHERGDVLEPPHRRQRLLLGRAIAREQQVVQPTEQMRQPELGIRRLWAQVLEAPHRHPDLVEQRRAVDFLVEAVHARFLEGGGERLEGGKMGGQGLGAEAAVAIVVSGHTGLCR